MIHVPPLPLLDGTTNYSGIQCDVVIRGSFEMDYTCPKDVTDHSSAHALGEIWDDTIDPATCPYGGYGIMEYSKSRVQWLTGTAQFIKVHQLKGVDKDAMAAVDVVNGKKDVGKEITSESTA